MQLQESLSIQNESSWKKDQQVITPLLKELNRYFGSSHNATGLEYLKQFDVELAKVESKLYGTTKAKLARIRADAELWMRNIYGSKWMQAEDYVTKLIAYTNYIYTL